MRLFVGYFTSKQHASVSQEQICSDNCTCYHTKIEVAVTQSQYSDTRPAKPSDDPIMPGALQGSYWSANFQVTGMTRARKITGKAGIEPRVCRSRGGRLYHEVNEAVKKKNPTNNKLKQKHAMTHFYCLHFEPALIPMHTCVFAFFFFLLECANGLSREETLVICVCYTKTYKITRNRQDISQFCVGRDLRKGTEFPTTLKRDFH